MGTDIKGGDRHNRRGQTSKVGTDIIRGDRHKKLRSRVGGWVVKRDFRTHSGSSEHSLDSESKFEPSVAIISKRFLTLVLWSRQSW